MNFDQSIIIDKKLIFPLNLQPEYYDTWERVPLQTKPAPPTDSHLVELTPGKSFSRMTDYRR